MTAKEISKAAFLGNLTEEGLELMILRHMEEHILLERDRCARIVEGFDGWTWTKGYAANGSEDQVNLWQGLEKIAAEIRAGNSTDSQA